MEGVKVSQYGLLFVWECLKKYFGGSWEIAAVCLLGMIVSPLFLLWEKNTEGGESPAVRSGVTRMNWVLFIVLGLTVYNPFLVKKIVPRIGMTSVYYRAFWAFPFLPAAAYYLTGLVFRGKKKAARAGIFSVIAAASIAVMPLNPGIRYHLQMPDNVYKVYGSIPVICDAIHEDFETKPLHQYWETAAEKTDPMTKKGAASYALTLPKCVFPYELEFQVRQYDPSIALTFSRNMRLYYEGNRATGIGYSEKSAGYARRKTILDAMYARDPSVTITGFQKAMRRTFTSYLVVENTKDNQDFLTTAGCTLIGDEAGYHIYFYDILQK